MEGEGKGFDSNQYEDEARERWGHTDAYGESKKRTASFTEEDWTRIQEEQESVEEQFAELLRRGVEPESPEAMEVAEDHRRHIGNFYPCSHAMHVGLGQMYTADPRFSKHYNKREAGLADFVSAAIQANAQRAANEG